MTSNLEPILRKPTECSESEIATFERLVLQGGEVRSSGLRDRIRKADWLAFISVQGDEIIAVGALKHPDQAYRARVFQNAGSQRNPNNFTLELGWVFVAEQYRGKGLASSLVRTLVSVASDASVYATSRSDNLAMHSALEKHDFARCGSAYRPEGDGDQLVLFVRLA